MIILLIFNLQLNVSIKVCINLYNIANFKLVIVLIIHITINNVNYFLRNLEKLMLIKKLVIYLKYR